MLTGRCMPVPPAIRLPHKGPNLEQLQMELSEYMTQLTAIHRSIYLQEKAKEPKADQEAERQVVPGDQVYLKVFRRKWHEPRREGPYTVVRATPTAVQVEGSTTWYHLSHCTKVQAETKGSIKLKNNEENDVVVGGSNVQPGVAINRQPGDKGDCSREPESDSEDKEHAAAAGVTAAPGNTTQP